MAKETFNITSKQGSKVKVVYTPTGSIKVTDKKAFEGYLKDVIDYIEVDGKLAKDRVLPEEKATAKKEVETPKTDKPKVEKGDLFGGGKGVSK